MYSADNMYGSYIWSVITCSLIVFDYIHSYNDVFVIFNLCSFCIFLVIFMLDSLTISIVKQLKSEIYLLICSKVQLFYCPVLSSLNS